MSELTDVEKEMLENIDSISRLCRSDVVYGPQHPFYPNDDLEVDFQLLSNAMLSFGVDSTYINFLNLIWEASFWNVSSNIVLNITISQTTLEDLQTFDDDSDSQIIPFSTATRYFSNPEPPSMVAFVMNMYFFRRHVDGAIDIICIRSDSNRVISNECKVADRFSDWLTTIVKTGGLIFA
ncbi:MAG: hypothetical protein ACRC8S_11730 [Fimbriiglobus sp.]